MLAIFSLPAVTDGLPWWLSRYRIYLQCRRHRRGGFNPWVRKIPSKRKWQPTPEFLPEKPLDRGAWWAAVQRVWKSWTQLSMPSLTVTSFFHVLSKEKFFSLLHLFGGIFSAFENQFLWLDWKSLLPNGLKKKNMFIFFFYCCSKVTFSCIFLHLKQKRSQPGTFYVRKQRLGEAK